MREWERAKKPTILVPHKIINKSSECPNERGSGGRACVPITHAAVDLGRTDRPVAEVLPDQERARAGAGEECPGRVLGDVRMPLDRRQAGRLGQAPPESGEGRARDWATVSNKIQQSTRVCEFI